MDIFEAAKEGNLDRILELIQEEVDLNIRYESFGTGLKQTPLHIAASEGHLDIVNALIAAGAHVNVKDNWGMTPINLAADKGHLNIINALIDAEADLNIGSNYGSRPLHLAAAEGHLNIVNALIAMGVDVNIRNLYGYRPLHYATSRDHLEVISVLIAAGADINIQDDEGNTPLHFTAPRDHLGVISVLIAAGADINLRNNKGETPLQVAQRNNNHNIVHFINKYKLMIARQRLNIALGLSRRSTLDNLKGGLDPWGDLLKISHSSREVIDRQDAAGEQPLSQDQLEYDEDFLQSFADEGIYFTPRSGPKFGGRKKRTKRKSNR